MKCLWLPRGLAGQPWHLGKRWDTRSGAQPDTMGFFDVDAVLMGGRHREEAGYVSSQVFARLRFGFRPIL